MKSYLRVNYLCLAALCTLSNVPPFRWKIKNNNGKKKKSKERYWLNQKKKKQTNKKTKKKIRINKSEQALNENNKQNKRKIKERWTLSHIYTHTYAKENSIVYIGYIYIVFEQKNRLNILYTHVCFFATTTVNSKPQKKKH